jgi:uncharacterized membrane protein YdjX (TVP38/TMEM64 family)
MRIVRMLMADRRVRLAGFLLGLAGLVLIWLAWQAGVDLARLKEIWRVTEEFLKRHPMVLFLALVILPGLPVPTSALLLTAGVVWRDRPVIACGLCLLALALNLSWTYWLAAGPARRVVEKLLRASEVQIPDLPRGDHLKLILVLKLTPGIPLFFQNYLLGFLHAPFRLYLLISMLGNGLIGTGIVLSGAGISDGRLMPALTGLSLIVVGIVLTHLIRGWLGGRGRAEKLKS